MKIKIKYRGSRILDMSDIEGTRFLCTSTHASGWNYCMEEDLFVKGNVYTLSNSTTIPEKDNKDIYFFNEVRFFTIAPEKFILIK